MDKWVLRKGTAFGMKLFGTPFFGMGSFFIYLACTTDKINDGPPTLAMRIGMAAFASIFVLIGACFIGGFQRWTIDRNRKLKKAKGLFFIPIPWGQASLEAADRLELSKDARTSRSKNGTRTYYVFTLKLFHQGGHELVGEASKISALRRKGEELAKFLDVNFVELLNGEKVERSVDELDMSVAEMNERDGIVFEKPEEPVSLLEGLSSDWDDEGNKRQVIKLVSPAGRHKAPALAACVVAVICLAWLVYFASQIEHEHVMKTIFEFISFKSLIPLAILFMIVSKLTQALIQTSFYLSKQEVCVKRVFFFFWRTYRVKAKDLELIKVVKSRGTFNLLLVSDDLHLQTAKFIPEEELKYVVELAQYMMQKK